MGRVFARFVAPVVGSVLCLGVGGAWAAEGPVAVSPGEASKVARIGDRCPAFSWGAVPGAEGYELIVVRVREGKDEPEPVLRETLPGSASTWTPSLERCLERGGRYGWSVRAVGAERATEWSAPSLFEVAQGPSAEAIESALRAVRGQRGAGAKGSPETKNRGEGATPSTASRTAPAATSAPALPPATTRLGIDGNVDAVSFTGNGENLVGVTKEADALAVVLCPSSIPTEGRRYLDLGDGTVLDCKTKLIWLKDADCWGLQTWAFAETDVAGLASGSCGLTDGSIAGDWRQPTISELCSAGAVTAYCPSGNASDSLIDTSLSGSPKVVNEIGDGQWSEGDAFSGVKTDVPYWSRTEASTDAWVAWLDNGYVYTLTKTGVGHVWPVRGGF